MKKFLFLLISFSFVSCFSQTQTFNTPPKFKNVVQNDLNTKILSINSTTNKLEWVNKSTLISSTPTFQQVLNSGNNSTNAGGVHFTLSSSGFNSSFYSTGVSASGTNGNNMSVNLAGLTHSNNDTRSSRLGYDGLQLRTTTFGNPSIYAFVKSDNITSQRILQLPNNSGTIPLSVNGNFADSSGNITVSGSSYTPPFQTFRSLIDQKGTGNPSQIILQDDPGLSFKWTRIAAGVYVSNQINLDPEKIFFSLTMRNDKSGNNCFQNSMLFYDTTGTYQLNSFVILTPNQTAPTSCSTVDDVLRYSEFELLIY